MAQKRGFPFAFAVDLLAQAEKIENKCRNKQIKAKERDECLERTIESWFSHHAEQLQQRLDVPSALFSMFFPKHRTDRVYGYRFERLYKALHKWLCISPSRTACLHPEAWVKNFSDFGAAVEKVLMEAENPIPGVDDEECVTVEEVDRVLDNMGSRNKFSNEATRRKKFEEEVDEVIGAILRRLSSEQAKWLMRIVLKEDNVVELPVSFTLGQYHFLLPHIYSVQHDLKFAFDTLNGPVLRYLPPQPNELELGKLLEGAAMQIKPMVGVQIQLPKFIKARSLKDAVRRVGFKKAYMERKYDGEYCQIHIDLMSQTNRIRIFSKSGRDSTEDRRRLWKAIEEGLRLNSKAKKIEQTCILEGEMFVFDENEKKYLDFCEIRKHVPRAGKYLGTWDDIKPDYKTQHLMIVFFDVLYHDSISLINTPFHERIKVLEHLVTEIPGLCELPERHILDFSVGKEETNVKQVTAIFERGIASRYEGYVLKPFSAPYIGFGLNGNQGRWIKLKKDYIPGLGDTMDVCIIGACHDPERALKMKGITPSTFTSFHVAYCNNKVEAERTGERRIFFVVDVVTWNIPDSMLKFFNNYFRVKGIDYKDYMEAEREDKFDIKIRGEMPKMQKVIPDPLVVEISGGSFHKPQNCSYYILRWPRFVKFKEELSWVDAVDFRELQIIAQKAITVPEEKTQEEAAWGAKLDQSTMPKKRKLVEAVLPPPPSPRGNIQATANISKLMAGSFMRKSMREFGGQPTQDSRQSTEERETEDSPRLAYLELMQSKREKTHGEVLIDFTNGQTIDVPVMENQEAEENVNTRSTTAKLTVSGSPMEKTRGVIEVVGTDPPAPTFFKKSGPHSAERIVSNSSPSKRRRFQPPQPSLPCLSTIEEDSHSDDDLQIISHNIITPPNPSHIASPVASSSTTPTKTPTKAQKPRRAPTPLSPLVPTEPELKSPPVVIDLDPEPYPTPKSSPPIPENPFTNADILLGTHIDTITELGPLLGMFNVRTVQSLDSFLRSPNFDSRKVLLIDQRMVKPSVVDIKKLLDVVEKRFNRKRGKPRIDVYCWRGLKDIGVDGGGRGDWGLYERVSIP